MTEEPDIYNDSLMPGDHDRIELDLARRWQREKHIPIPAPQLTEFVLTELGLSTSQQCRAEHVCRLLDSALHVEYHARQKAIKSNYVPFDPDEDQNANSDANTPERKQAAMEMAQQVIELLELANYTRLSREEIKDALGSASQWGVNLTVNFDIFEQLDVYSRGEVMSRRPRRRWHRFQKIEEVEVEIYQRLVVIFRLRPDKMQDPNVNTSAVHIKLFKNIPKADIEMLLPGTRVRMSLLDQGKIWLPTLSGVVLTIWKLIQGAVIIAFAGMKGILATLMLIVGTIGYGVKSFFGYLNTRNRYQLNLTRNLYYQNIGNNSGVLFRLLDEAEEQDYREMLLAFFPLWKEAGGSGWTAKELDQVIERHLQNFVDIDVDFEVDDALAKLLRYGLVVPLPEDKFRAVSLHEAQVLLEKRLLEGTPLDSSKRFILPFTPAVEPPWAAFRRSIRRAG